MQNLKWLERKAIFMGSADSLEESDRVIIGLPMDSTTSFRPGTRMAPYRIREVSEEVEEYSIYQDRSLDEIAFYDAGDVQIPFGNVEQSLARMEDTARRLLARRKKIFSIGGEHLVSLPIIKAYKEIYPDLAVIQMDAHADLRDNYLGEPLSHASVMNHVLRLVGDKNLFQLGIRSGTREEMQLARRCSNLYLDQFLTVLPEVKQKIGRRPVYLTLDIDVLDPAFAPGTGTPEAGGVSSRDLITALLEMASLNIVGFDMVEISPPYDIADNTSILGAKILREALLAY
ncbi:MAG: agmatinase [Syntrophomonadaceae bacterium]|nr:agmatinase [Syntrophomonadaceae bacterium]